jgi:hypothetical protein
MPISLEEAERYYKKGEKPANKEIKKILKKKKVIVHGGRALNIQLPDYLDRPTKDWDVFAKSPKKIARVIERRLDRRYGGNYFVVKPGKHKGTYRIISRVTGESICDVTAIPSNEEIPTVTIRGIKYATLDYHVRKIKQILKDPKSKYRHQKDKDMLRRIMIYKKKYEKKEKKKKKAKKTKKKSYKDPMAVLNQITRNFGL